MSWKVGRGRRRLGEGNIRGMDGTRGGVGGGYVMEGGQGQEEAEGG